MNSNPFQAYQIGFTYNYLFKCERFEFLSAAAKQEVQLGCWLFLSLRLFEYVETIFFVLRKKQRQASFLHIFHHIGSVLMTWLFLASRAGKLTNSCSLHNRRPINLLPRRADGCLHRHTELGGAHLHVHVSPTTLHGICKW